MRRKKRTEIMVEQHERLIIHLPAAQANANCHICPTHTQMITAEDAAMLFKMTHREVYRVVETGNVHFTESTDGLLYVCVQSLFSFNSPVRFLEEQMPEPKETDTDF